MTKPTILFIQGGGEGAYNADKKLAASLTNRLGKSYSVKYPKMPNENDPQYETFKNKIEEELKEINGKVILVGHSVGSCFILKYFSEKQIDKNIAGIFLIATPFWGKGGWQYEGFTIDNELVSKLTAGIPMYFYHSTEDETVPFSHLAKYEKIFPHAKVRKIVGRGHQLDNDLSEVAMDIKSLDVT